MVAPARQLAGEIDEVPARAVLPDEEAASDQAVATAGSHVAIDDEAEKAKTKSPPADGEVAIEPAAGVEGEADADAPPAGKTMTLGGCGHVWIKGDTLWEVSKFYYGEGKHWRTIKAANADKVKKGLEEGHVLDIPAVELDTLTALLRFKDQPRVLCDLVSLMPHADYEGFFDQLTPAQIEKHGAFLQVLELMRATGKTVKELVSDQRAWLEEKAAAEGKDIGELVGGAVEEKGYGGGETPVWDNLSVEEHKELKRRFLAVVNVIKDTAPADVQEIIATAEAKGGGFRWSPKDVEAKKAFAYTQLGWDLHCGVKWVKAAETDPTTIHGSIAHEMGGHNYYGIDHLGYAIQTGAMTDREERSAEKSGNSIYSAYGYMETEIFAELYEYEYNFPGTEDRDYPGDTAFDTDKEGRPVAGSPKNPLGDTFLQLQRIREAFAPDVADGLVASLTRRVELDPRILPEAKERYNEAVRYVFTP
jgi:hypothetical protein